MLEIQKELDQFILTIKNTQVYKEYQLQKSKVKENPDLKKPAEAPGRPPILCPGCPHRRAADKALPG